MSVTAPRRYDLQETSRANKEIEVFNRKLHKVVKTADNAKVLQADLSRKDFTCHGLHLNISGKEKMAKLIGVSGEGSLEEIRSSKRKNDIQPRGMRIFNR